MAWLLTESDSTAQLSWLPNDEGALISNAFLMGQTSVSFESMSSIMQEKTHKKRPYGSLRTPPIPALPGFPKNPLHPILQTILGFLPATVKLDFFFLLMQGSTVYWLIDHGSPVSCGF